MANINQGSFLPTTSVWDVSEIYTTEVSSPAFKELLVRLYQNLNNMANAVNIRDAALYDTTDFVCGQRWFPNPANTSLTASVAAQRQVYRKVINFGALPNTGVTNVAHGITITPTTTFTRIYGAASDPIGSSYLPLPYASPTLVNNIELSVGAANVTITTGSNRAAYTVCYIVLEYIKT